MTTPPPIRPLILGIDPGQSGALAWFDVPTQLLSSIHDMPTQISFNRAHTKERKIIDTDSLAATMKTYAAQTAFAVVEEVHSMPDNGPVQAFKFGFNAGIIKGMLAAFQIPAFYIPPQIWKGLMGLSSDKNKSLELAIKRFPYRANNFSRKKDDGRAEAALLTLFGLERFWPSINGRKQK